MAQIEARVYKLTEASRPLFYAIFPDMDPDAQYVLISSEGMMTFNEEPAGINVPHMLILTYFDVTFESE